MNTMTKLAAAVALTVSFTASADYVGTSQFDGKSTWINTYVDVNDALGFSEVNRDFSYNCNCGGSIVIDGELSVNDAISFAAKEGYTVTADQINSVSGSSFGGYNVSVSDGTITISHDDGTGGSAFGASAIKVLPMATNADAIRGDHKITLEGLVTDFMK